MNPVLESITHLIPDKLYLKLKFRQRTGKRLNLREPRTFNEKLQWLKLYDRKPLYSTLVDKYEAKEYVAGIIGDEYIIPTLGVWDRFDDIDFDSLPNQFVLKCTHDSGGLVIVKDKSRLDFSAAKNKIEKRMKKNYYWHGREWVYKDVKPRIIAEQYMEDYETKELRDYKVYTFMGKAKFMMIAQDRQKGKTKAGYYDENFNQLNLTWGYPNPSTKPQKPVNYKKMFQLAEKISRDLIEARVDFYEVNNKVYWGEITFFDGSGFDLIKPEEWDYKFGSWIELPKR